MVLTVASRAAKRTLDITISALGLIVALPILTACGVAIWSSVGTPILFRQTRPGLHERPFVLLKFRTMTEARDSRGELLPDEQRLTRVGRFLRSTTLDEFPELWNVLKGEMSLVGPRPLLARYLPRYSAEQRRRHDVRPGLTGWAVVQGRNTLSWEERLALDVWYVDNANLALDAQILLRTIWLVIRRKGVNAEGHATMPEFNPGDGQ